MKMPYNRITILILAASISLVSLACGEPEEEDNHDHHHENHANHSAHENHSTGGTQREALSEGGNYHIHWESDPAVIPHNELFDMEVIVHDSEHKPLDGEVSITVDATMPAHGHGMEVTPTVDGGPTTFNVEGMKLHMMGEWEFGVNVDGPNGQDTAKMKIACCE